MTSGEKIISAINERDLACGLYGETPIWQPSAAEQLEALVEEIVRERLAEVEAARKILEGKP